MIKSASTMVTNHHTQRCFIAIDLPPTVKESLRKWQQQWQTTAAKVRWTPPEQMHLTLCFLGDIDTTLVPAIVAGVMRVAGHIAPFDLSFTAPGYFGSARAPRVLWVGVDDGSARLKNLQQQLAAMMRTLGIPLENRPFHPHVTLGRVRSIRNGRTLTSSLQKASLSELNAVHVDRIGLYASELAATGARHTLLNTIPLQGEP